MTYEERIEWLSQDKTIMTHNNKIALLNNKNNHNERTVWKLCIAKLKGTLGKKFYQIKENWNCYE